MSGAAGEVRDDEWGAEMGEPETPRRGPGRPRKDAVNPGAVKETVIRRRVIEDGAEDDQQPQTFAALFGQTADTTEDKRVAKVRIIRVEPNEGVLGYVEDMEATDALIFDKWGGSTYRLEGVNSRGVYVKGAIKTLKLSGDPIFKGELFEMQWRRSHNLPPREKVAAPQGMNAQQVLEMVEQQEDKRRERDRLWEEERRKRDEDADERRRERERAHELKLKEIEEERDRRRRQDADDRERERRADMERQQAQSQQFMQTMLGIITTSNQQSMQLLTSVQKSDGGGGGKLIEAVQVIASIKEAFGGGASDAADVDLDPMQLLVKNLPGILQGIGSAGQAIVGEIRANRPATVAPGVQQRVLPAAPGAAAPAAPPVPVPAGGLTLPPDSPLTPKLIELTQEIAAKGQNPEVVLAGVADGLLHTLRTGKPPEAMPVGGPERAAAAGEINSLASKEPVRIRFRKRR